MKIEIPEGREEHFHRFLVHAATLLSLDCTLEAARHAGADFEKHAEMMEALRATILLWRNSRDDLKWGSSALSSWFIQELRKRCSDGDLAKFVWWTSVIWENERSRELSVWREVLTHFFSDRTVWAASPISAARFETFRLECSSYLGPFPNPKLGYDPMLSDWDLHIFALWGFNEDVPHITCPDTEMFSCERNFRAIDFWSKIHRRFSSAEIESIYQALLLGLNSEEHRRFSGDDLPAPSSFLPLLSL